MQQFLDRERWKGHIDKHIEELDDYKANRCPHPRPKCVDAFQSVLEMKFHLQDVHCIEVSKGVKRRKSLSEEEPMPVRRKRSRQSNNHDPNAELESGPRFTYKFVDETTKLCSQQYARTSTTPSVDSNCSSPSNTATTDEITDATETPASSVYNDIFDKLDPRLLDE